VQVVHLAGVGLKVIQLELLRLGKVMRCCCAASGMRLLPWKWLGMGTPAISGRGEAGELVVHQ
jgi:hypothetical protein